MCLVRECDVGPDAPWSKLRGVSHFAGIVFREPADQIIGDACVEVFSREALENVNVFHDSGSIPASWSTRRQAVIASTPNGGLSRGPPAPKGSGGTTFAMRRLVEAAGVEPASEIAVSRENPCSVQFRMFSPQTLRTDKMRLKLVR